MSFRHVAEQRLHSVAHAMLRYVDRPGPKNSKLALLALSPRACLNTMQSVRTVPSVQHAVRCPNFLTGAANL